jgi:hypothetical protein
VIVKLIKIHDKEIFELHSYTLLKNYIVLTIENNYYRLISDAGEPILYPIKCFEIMDPQIPSFWNAYYSSECNTMDLAPEYWLKSNFWSNYFDYKPPTVEIFWKDCRELYDIKYFVVQHNEFEPNENGIELTCISKHAYLRETETKDMFELMSEYINPNEMEEIHLTVGKKYILEESRRCYWFKIKDDNGNYYFYPKSMFQGWIL